MIENGQYYLPRVSKKPSVFKENWGTKIGWKQSFIWWIKCSKIYIYSGRTGDKAQTISFRFPQDAHMTGILYIDNNRYINIFAFGRMSGVAEILNSASAVPSLNSNDNTVSVNLTIWGNCKLITIDRDVKVIGSL